MVGRSIRDTRQSVESIGRKQVVGLFGTRVAETILASGPSRPHQQAGHMDASDPIRPQIFLRHGGRPHMGPGFRRDDALL
jgi:hypothetical protein